jgi:ribonuclease D
LNHDLGEMLGVSVEKKYQRYNWMRRPIDPNAMEYALTDVKYLFELRDRLQEQVLRKGRLPELLRSVAREDINYEKKGIPSIQKEKPISEIQLRPEEDRRSDFRRPRAAGGNNRLAAAHCPQQRRPAVPG